MHTAAQFALAAGWPEITDQPCARCHGCCSAAPVRAARASGSGLRGHAAAHRPRTQTISQPYIVAVMTQALRLIPTAACWRSAPGRATRPPCWRISRRTCGAWRRCPNWPARPVSGWRAGLFGDGQGGRRPAWVGPNMRPTTASSWPRPRPDVPPALVRSWPRGGRLVIPVGESPWDQTLWLIEKSEGGRLAGRAAGRGAFRAR